MSTPAGGHLHQAGFVPQAPCRNHFFRLPQRKVHENGPPTPGDFAAPGMVPMRQRALPIWASAHYSEPRDGSCVHMCKEGPSQHLPCHTHPFLIWSHGPGRSSHGPGSSPQFLSAEKSLMQGDREGHRAGVQPCLAFLALDSAAQRSRMAGGPLLLETSAQGLTGEGPRIRVSWAEEGSPSRILGHQALPEGRK